jgi:hypothetical protein
MCTRAFVWYAFWSRVQVAHGGKGRGEEGGRARPAGRSPATLAVMPIARPGVSFSSTFCVRECGCEGVCERLTCTHVYVRVCSCAGVGGNGGAGAQGLAGDAVAATWGCCCSR